MLHGFLRRSEKGPQPVNAGRRRRLEEARRRVLPGASGMNQPCPHLNISSGKLISDF